MLPVTEMVNVKALIASIERISWKNGNVTGKVTHEVDADGNHTIVVRVPEKLAEWAPPPTYAPTAFRENADLKWEDIKPPPRPPTKKR